MNIHFQRFIGTLILFLDLMFLNLAVFLCIVYVNTFESEYQAEYDRFWILLNVFWIIASWILDIYNEKSILSFETFCRLTMQAFFYCIILNLFYLYFAHQYELSRYFITATFVLSGVLLFLNRCIFLLIRSYLRKHHLFAHKVLIIGYNDIGKKLASYLEEDDMNNEVVGFCEEAENVHELSNYPIVDTIDNSINVSINYQVKEIYSTIAPEQNKVIYKLMQEADQSCIHFRIIPDLSFFVNRTFHVDYLKDIPVMFLRQEPLSDASNRFRKRLFDVIFSAFIIVGILSWLIPIIAILIYLESPGPIFFTQSRTGKGGKSFTCFKFRSMKLNNEADLRQASLNDDRLTRVGKFLRKTNLDEFPQFINVLIGDMSVVGPRPHMLQHTRDYSKLIDHYMIRQFLNPGITGWAQINGFRGETKTLYQMQGRIEYDIWYMENWSLWLDIRIILSTLFLTIRGDKQAF